MRRALSLIGVMTTEPVRLKSEHLVVRLSLGDMPTTLALGSGMAKLFASEACAKISLDALRVLGGYGYMAEFPVERFYRDAPLMMIGEGTNEIQALVIARGLIARNKI